jgi:hypothetical protein
VGSNEPAGCGGEVPHRVAVARGLGQLTYGQPRGAPTSGRPALVAVGGWYVFFSFFIFYKIYKHFF